LEVFPTFLSTQNIDIRRAWFHVANENVKIRLLHLFALTQTHTRKEGQTNSQGRWSLDRLTATENERCRKWCAAS